MKSRGDILNNLFEEILQIRKKAIHKDDGKDKSISQAHILSTISHFEGISINEIAKRLNITGSAVTQFIDSFVDEGWVNRQEDPNDRRRMNVTITEKGREKLKDFHGFFKEKFEKYLSDVTDEELNVLINILKKVNNKLS